MGRKGKELSSEKKSDIIRLLKDGKSISSISEITKIPRTTINSVIKKFNESGSIENFPRIGRPKKLTDHNERYLMCQVKANPRLNASELAKMSSEQLNIDVTPQTVRNMLHKQDFHARIAKKKPYISKKNRQIRLAFGKEHINKPLEFWKDVIFADESKFNLFGCDGRKFIYRKPTL